VPEHVTHWDEAEREHAVVGSIAGWWTALGDAAGSVRVAVNRIQVEPGKRSTPLHMEGDDVKVQRRDLGAAAGSVRNDINHNWIAPGMLSSPPHQHSVGPAS
jgi:uncharacterized cupin superfamily protein